MLSLEKIIETQSKTIEMMANELTLLREQVEYLRQKLYGKSSEKVVYQPGQLSLFGEESLPEEEADLPS
ncbi:MAG: Transposase C of IS166 homeodomain protein [Deltaproteobacteria bacterium ADurb.Bin135]|nr:MAG: Transposase C of IS166 homeodomain protein [Deltaproteobacteria bacterium ADurb.Bin135]